RRYRRSPKPGDASFSSIFPCIPAHRACGTEARLRHCPGVKNIVTSVGGEKGEDMSAADQYRRNASECVAITAFFVDSQQRATILALAEAWTRLAQQAEKYEEVALATSADAPPHPNE